MFVRKGRRRFSKNETMFDIYFNPHRSFPVDEYISDLRFAMLGISSFHNYTYLMLIKYHNPMLYKKVRESIEVWYPTFFKQLKIIEQYHRTDHPIVKMGLLDVRAVPYYDYLNDKNVSLAEKKEILLQLKQQAPLIYCDVVAVFQDKNPESAKSLGMPVLTLKDRNLGFSLYTHYLDKGNFSQIEKEKFLKDLKELVGDYGFAVILQEIEQKEGPLVEKIVQTMPSETKSAVQTVNLLLDKEKSIDEKQTQLTNLQKKDPLAYQQVSLVVHQVDKNLAQQMDLPDVGLQFKDLQHLKTVDSLVLHLVDEKLDLKAKQKIVSEIKRSNSELFSDISQKMTRYFPKEAQTVQVYEPQARWSKDLDLTIQSSVAVLQKRGKDSLSPADKALFLKDIKEKDPLFFKDLKVYLAEHKPTLYQRYKKEFLTQSSVVAPEASVVAKREDVTTLTEKDGIVLVFKPDSTVEKTASLPKTDGVFVSTQASRDKQIQLDRKATQQTKVEYKREDVSIRLRQAQNQIKEDQRTLSNVGQVVSRGDGFSQRRVVPVSKKESSK